MKNLLKIKVDEFNAKMFMRDILNYCRKELTAKDILWWIEGKNEKDILKFNPKGCLEEQFFNYIKQAGNKLNIPFFIHGNVKTGEMVNMNGEYMYVNMECGEELNTVGIEIENMGGSFLISTIAEDGAKNIDYIKSKYRVA
ncbi:hypothetical protein [uncultured Clostridium sp.]|uniref:hypothetical protein n=1 Tax=uncultured Clostridium sp. TaxID=59620 RepID=UPI002621D528|nr:hypothetical protein [uncultured Clostridium sp.]